MAIVACVGLYLWLALPLLFPVRAYCGDEGYYALAARNVADGSRPYRDHLFTQMPLLPYAYAGWFRIFGSSMASGRGFSVTMTAAAIVCVMLTCRRRAGLWPAILAGLLWSTSIYTAIDLGSVKTQSLSNFLVAATLLAIPGPDSSRRFGRAALAMGLMSLAFFTRLTLIIPLVLLWVYLAWEFRRGITRYALLLTANVLLLAAAVAFFWSDGNMWFGVYVTHHDFYGASPWTWGRLGWTVKHTIGNQLVIATLLLLAAVRFVTLVADRSRWPELAFPAFCFASYLSVTLAHWSQVQSYPTHQTVITGFAIVFIAQILAPVITFVRETWPMPAAAAFALFVAMCSPFSECGLAPLVERGNKPDWLKKAVEILGRHAKPGDDLLTFNVELAIEGDYSVFHGCEMSEWGYLANVPDDVAEKRNILNMRHLIAAIREEKAPILTVTDRDFGIMSTGNVEIAKKLKNLIDEHYYNVGIVKQYGQFSQDLYLLKRMGKAKSD